MTPDEIREQIAGGRAALKAALEGAAANWEKAPAAGEGEEAWSPRQVAEHVIPAEAFFTTAVCDACGYPGVDGVEGNFPTQADALAAFEAVDAASNGKLKYVTEKDLTMTHEKMGPVLGMLQMSVGHLNEHAAQIAALS